MEVDNSLKKKIDNFHLSSFMSLSVASCFCLSRPFPYAAAGFHRHSLLIFILARRTLALILSLFLCSIIAVFVSRLFVLFCFRLFCLAVSLFCLLLFCLLLVVLLLRRLRSLLLYLCYVLPALIISFECCSCLFVSLQKPYICDDFNTFLLHSISNNK